jgi:dienelactone hydrolase
MTVLDGGSRYVKHRLLDPIFNRSQYGVMKNLIFAGCLALALSCQAKLVTKAVEYEQGGAKLRGYLAYDDVLTAKGKLPGVLVIHEWWGLNDYIKRRLREVAQLGYVAFAPDIYGNGQVATTVAEAEKLSGQFYDKPLLAERAQAGLEVLEKTELVNEKKLASIGYCFGGSASLALAYSGAPLAAVATFHGGLIVPSLNVGEKTHAKFLIMHGGIDPTESPEKLSQFIKAFNDNKLDYQLVIYSGAKHAFTNPDSDRLARENHLDAIGYNADADKASWGQLKTFLSNVFGS